MLRSLHTHPHTHTHAHVHTHTCTDTHTHAGTHTRTHAHTVTNARTHIRTHTHTHAPTHTHTHKPTYTLGLEARLARKHLGFVLGIRETTVCLHAIGSVLIYYAVYGYGWAVLFRGSIILAPITPLMRK